MRVSIGFYDLRGGKSIKALHESIKIFVLSRGNFLKFFLLYFLYNRLIKIHFEQVEKTRKGDNRKCTKCKN